MSMTVRTIGCGGHHVAGIRLDHGYLGGSQRPLRLYRQWQCLSLILKIPEWPRNPDFRAPEGPIFYLSARLWITSKTLVLASLRSLARRRLLGITGSSPPGARWLRDQSRSRLTA
jgi:hypothetical protein